MATGKITMNRGTTEVLTVNYQEDGAAASIAGATILFTVKEDEYDSNTTDTSALIKKDVTAHTDAANGVSSITILPTDTRSLTPGTYFYSIKIDKNSNDTNVIELAEGKFVLDGDPTNRVA